MQKKLLTDSRRPCFHAAMTQRTNNPQTFEHVAIANMPAAVQPSSNLALVIIIVLTVLTGAGFGYV
jgi:alanine dehydrogenase